MTLLCLVSSHVNLIHIIFLIFIRSHVYVVEEPLTLSGLRCFFWGANQNIHLFFFLLLFSLFVCTGYLHGQGVQHEVQSCVFFRQEGVTVRGAVIIEEWRPRCIRFPCATQKKTVRVAGACACMFVCKQKEAYSHFPMINN